MTTVARRSASLFLRALLAGGLACASPADAQVPAQDVLRIALSSPVGPLDPALAPSPEQVAPVFGAYQQLVTPEGLPELAANWSSDPGGLVWTFSLSPGHRFDDGAPVDASAVVFSMDRLAKLGRGPASDFTTYVAGVSAKDDATVIFKLKQPTPRLLSILSDRAASIVNPDIARHAIEGDFGSGWLSTRTAGSGPYVLGARDASGAYVLKRNPYFAGPKPYFSRLIYTVIPDPTVRSLAVGAGKVDLAVLLPFQALKRLGDNSEVRIVSQPALAFQNIAFNLDRPLLRDIRLRKAIALAIDTDAIVRFIRGGRASQFFGPLAPGMIGAEPGAYTIRYDPEEAKRLVRDSGVSPGQRLTMVYPGLSPETDTVAQYIQAQLASLGLLLRLERLSTAAYLDRMQRGAYDLVLMGWVCSHSDAAAILDFWFEPSKAGVNNPARYNNPEVTWRIHAAQRELDPVRRADLHRQIAQLVNADLPYIYLQQTHVAAAVRSDIVGYSMDPVRALELPLAVMRRSR